MVITREIPRAQWRRVLDDLSRVHAGAAVRLVVFDEAFGLESHGDAFRLAGLSADGELDAEAIAVMIVGPTRVTHLIELPRRLLLEQLWETRTAHLQVEDGHGTRTLISLGPPVVGYEAPPCRALTAPRRAACGG